MDGNSAGVAVIFMTASVNRGFTLIEMLVSLSIFASLMAVLMIGYSQGLSLWDRGRNHAGYWQGLEFRHGLMGSLFSQAQYADYRKVGGAFVPHFQGGTQSLEFVSAAPILDFAGRLQVVRLTIETLEGTQQLTYQESGRFTDPARGIDWSDVNSVVVISAISDASFIYEASAFPLPGDLDPNYLDAGDKLRYRAQPEWLKDFDSNIIWRIPQRVAINFTGQDGIQHEWVFAVPQAADAWSLEIYSLD